MSDLRAAGHFLTYEALCWDCWFDLGGLTCEVDTSVVVRWASPAYVYFDDEISVIGGSTVRSMVGGIRAVASIVIWGE